MKLEGLQPIGSVIRLKNGKKKLMIVGHSQKMTETNELFDYSGVLFPEGFLDGDHLYFFNDEFIEEVFHIGYLNENAYEEIANAVDYLNEKKPE